MKWRHLALLLLLATAAVVRAEEEAKGDKAEVDDDEEFDEERAILLVRRAVADERPLEGKQTTVTISVYNAGNTAASNIKVTDTPWPADGFAVEGELTAAFDSIPVGTSVQYSYKVTPKEAGIYQHAPVTVTYKPADEEEEQTATSAALAFRTFTVGQTLTIKALELGSRLSGGNLNSLQDWQRAGIVVAVALVAFLGYRSYTSVSESQRNRRRAKALADLAALEKDK
jgi:translocon-associated protein subunit beta